jgi:hypothetical protein
MLPLLLVDDLLDVKHLSLVLLLHHHVAHTQATCEASLRPSCRQHSADAHARRQPPVALPDTSDQCVAHTSINARTCLPACHGTTNRHGTTNHAMALQYGVQAGCASKRLLFWRFCSQLRNEASLAKISVLPKTPDWAEFGPNFSRS